MDPNFHHTLENTIVQINNPCMRLKMEKRFVSNQQLLIHYKEKRSLTSLFSGIT